jgi:hypothetical protein
MKILTLLLIIIFLLGLYFYTNPGKIEGFNGKSSVSKRCPNMLIQKGSKFYLYNSKVAKVPGVNPIEFENLEDYSEFLDWQRSQGIRCPVLYLQETYDAQGQSVYKVRPSVHEPQAGLSPSIEDNMGIASQGPQIIHALENVKPPNPTLLVDATRNDPPYNTNSYPSYDESSYYIGTTTPLDVMDYKQENAPISPNPMDSNWGGQKYTQNLIDKGYYRANDAQVKVN